MRIFVNVLCYDRPNILRASAATIMANACQFDSHVLFSDDGHDPEVARILRHTLLKAETDLGSSCPVFVISKSRSMGMVHSAKIALAYARMFSPNYWFIAESDYIFRPDAYRYVINTFENSDQGKMCLGIVGYDHPNCYQSEYRDVIFPECMKAQVGEDNVNREAMYGGGPIELVSNTCPTCYLNWHRIVEIGREFPEIHTLLDRAMDPQDDPGYPASSDYRRLQMVDDGMLSHAISLVWNKWAIKHGIDRDRFGAWLNIKPSVANAITGAGIHARDCPEGSSTASSPTWQ